MPEEPTEPMEGEKQIFAWVNKQGIMWKFKFYGFFKNLKFFEALLRSILVIIFAPLCGFIAEVYSIEALFLWLGIFILFLNFFILRGDYKIAKN